MNAQEKGLSGLDQVALSQARPHEEVNGAPPDGEVEEADGEELKYLPVPPRKTVTVTVRYRVRSRGQPLPYQLGEGHGE